MRVSDMAFLRHHWHPVAVSERLTDGPLEFTLLGERLVVWRGEDDAVAVASVWCPHRGANLSDGWTDDGCLVCPYHGWRFDTTGRCISIPHLAADLPVPPKAHIATGHAIDRYGLIWACLDDPVGPLPVWPEGEDPRFRCFVEFFEPRMTAAPRVIDNAIDATHITFVHQGTFSTGDRLTMPPLPEVVPTEHGPSGTLVFEVPGNAQQIGIVDAPAGASFTRRTTISVIAPLCVHTRFEYTAFPGGERDYAFLGLASPIDDESSMYVRLTALGGTEEDQPYELFHQFSEKVQAEDRMILDRTSLDFPLDISTEVHLRSDKHTLEYRKYLARLHSEASR